MDPFGYNQANDASTRAGAGILPWRAENGPMARSPLDERYELSLLRERLFRRQPMSAATYRNTLSEALVEYESLRDPDEIDTPLYKKPEEPVTVRRRRRELSPEVIDLTCNE